MLSYANSISCAHLPMSAGQNKELMFSPDFARSHTSNSSPKS